MNQETGHYETEHYMRTEYYYLDHNGRRELVDVDFTLYSIPNMHGMNPGQYSFPFSIKLPSWLPASMMLAVKDNKARMGVRYTLKAQLEPSNACD